MRTLDHEEARLLKPGDDHYLAYVGPPRQYDFMGATQFRLLATLGLREHHRVLDVGCGSLRAGRLLIPYLLPGHYYGLEPNSWLIEDAIDNQLGRDMLRVKRPQFDHNAEFRCGFFGVKFDFVLAQSIFSHSTVPLTLRALSSLAEVLSPSGLLVCTFVEGEASNAAAVSEEWVYPGCVTYSPAEIRDIFGQVGLFACRIPWYHPRQRWYLAAGSADQLPAEEHLSHLSGAVLRDPEFQASR